ncbi:uncharacterized protein LOC106464847 isoform X2 [Limulus polyphemus]|uniref:Uncharacterized protein LOC106464847 isoform X2 n=1 Tax=Limulus polyphemus TaxID=6850 RepID=A0ABM1BEP0_LIMPO|nr:uncharacterized protein LOC106464847 isoform X2 [Limulus polyphemus]
MMVNKGPYFINDFIVPSLDKESFFNLRWINRDQKLYKVIWPHKGSRLWKEKDFNIFREWDIMKGNHHPETPGYWTYAKQRFRNAHSKLEKLGRVKREKNLEAKGFRVYRIMNSIDPPQTHQKLCNLSSWHIEKQYCVSDDVLANTLLSNKSVHLYLVCEDETYNINLGHIEGTVVTAGANELLEQSVIQDGRELRKAGSTNRSVEAVLLETDQQESVVHTVEKFDSKYEDIIGDPILSQAIKNDKSINLVNFNLPFYIPKDDEKQINTVLDPLFDHDESLSLYDDMELNDDNLQFPHDSIFSKNLELTEEFRSLFGNVVTEELREKDFFFERSNLD